MSIPDELFQRADDLARRLGKARSELYREALAEYLARHDPRMVTATLDEVVARLGSDGDSWAVEAGLEMLRRSEW